MSVASLAGGKTQARVLTSNTAIIEEGEEYFLSQEKKNFVMKTARGKVIFDDGIAQLDGTRITSRRSNITIFVCSLQSGQTFQLGVFQPPGGLPGTEQWVSEEQGK